MGSAVQSLSGSQELIMKFSLPFFSLDWLLPSLILSLRQLLRLRLIQRPGIAAIMVAILATMATDTMDMEDGVVPTMDTDTMGMDYGDARNVMLRLTLLSLLHPLLSKHLKYTTTHMSMDILMLGSTIPLQLQSLTLIQLLQLSTIIL